VTIVPAMSSLQTAISNLFPDVDTSVLGNFSLKARAQDGGVFFAYGSVVDNPSGDPIFIRGEATSFTATPSPALRLCPPERLPPHPV